MTKIEFDKVAATKGFKPWGLTIPGNPQIDPKGSKLHQYKCGKKELHAIIDPAGVVVRAAIYMPDGRIEQLVPAVH